MKPKTLGVVSQRKGSPQSRSTLLASIPLFFCVLAAGGMTGGNCNVSLPVPEAFGFSVGLPTGGPDLLPTDHVIGDENAPVIVFEYFDFSQPVNGRFARSELPALIADYVDTGKIRFVLRHFPSSSRARAEPAAIASECASDEGMFLAYHDLIFNDQDDLSDERLREHAEALDLDLAAFDACAGGGSKTIRVQRDVTSGNALGVSTTPAFFVNGQAVPGFQSAEDLGKIIDKKINALAGD